MNHDYNCKAFVGGALCDVVASYDIGGPDTLVYGIFKLDDPDTDVTEKIHKDEFDRIYTEICTKVAGDMTDAAEMAEQGER